MFCPSCTKTYPEGEGRCPDCDAVLVAVIPLSAGEGAGPESVAHEPEEPVAGAESEVQAEPVAESESETVVVPPPVEEAEGGVEPEPEIPPNLEPATKAVTLVSPETPVAPPRPTAGMPKDRILIAGAAALVLLLVCLAFFGPSDPDPTPTSAATTASDANSWLDSASKSMERQDYPAAVTQYKKSLDLLEGLPESEPRVLAARTGLAQALEGTGDLEQAYTIWSVLEDPEAPAKASALARRLQGQGEQTLTEAAELLKSGDLKGAESQAKGAFVLFSDYGGTPEQQAAALEQLARVYIAGNRIMAAQTELTKAQRLVFSKERQTLLASLAPPPMARPKRRRGVPATAEGTPRRPRLQLDGSGVPQAARRTPAGGQAQSNEPARPRRRMKEIPIYNPDNRTAEEGDVPLGEKDVLQTYNTKRRKNRNSIPGL